MESVEVVEKLKKVTEEDEPRRRGPVTAGGVMFGVAGASTLEAAQERSRFEEPRKKATSTKGTGPNLMAEAHTVTLKPSSTSAVAEAAQMKEFLKKNGGLKEMDKPFLQLKGKKRIHVCHVAKKSSNMNEGDVFVLDTGLEIFVWNGEKASQVKKAKGLEVGHRIRDKEYGAKVDLTVLGICLL